MRSDIFVLFTRPFWLDEWHLILVAGRGSLGEVLADLKAGSDFAPPLLHFIVWLMHRVFGTVTPAMVHGFAFVCVTGAMVFVYQVLRRRFDRLPSLIGVLAVASQQLIVTHAFEGRFYGPLLLFCAAFAWTLSLDHDKPSSRRRDVAVALASIFLCTIHWFGVLSLGLVALGAMATFGRNWKEGLRRVAPAAAGIVALMACLPLFFGQRGSITEPTWIPDLNMNQVRGMANIVWLKVVPMLAVAILLLGELRPSKMEQRAMIVGAIRNPGIAGLLALSLMPILLIAISLKQPAMLERYAITTLLAWAPLAALAAQTVPTLVRTAALVPLAAALVLAIGHTVGLQREWAIGIAGSRNELRRACALKIPVAFSSRHLIYPIAMGVRESCPQARYLEISNATLARTYRAGTPLYPWQRFFRLENEFARMHDRLYGFPRVMTQAEFDTTTHFAFLAADISLPPGYKNMEVFGPIMFPNHRFRRVTHSVTLFERK